MDSSIGRDESEGFAKHVAQAGEILLAGFYFTIEPILEELVQLDDLCFDMQEVERVDAKFVGHVMS